MTTTETSLFFSFVHYKNRRDVKLNLCICDNVPFTQGAPISQVSLANPAGRLAHLSALVADMLEICEANL